MKISVIINTLNEEDKIETCLETVKWADEIILVDMYSDDNTVELAKKYTDKIYFFERCGYVEPARQFALEKTSNEWVFLVDADEVIPLSLKNRLIEIAANDKADVVFIRRNNYYFGQPLDGIRLFGQIDSHLRFFKKNCMNFSDRIHKYYNIKKNARKYTIRNNNEAIVHLQSYNFEEVLQKENNYTDAEAKNIIDGTKNFSQIILYSLYFFFIFFKELILCKFQKHRFQNLLFSADYIFYAAQVYSKLQLYDKYESMNFSKEIKKDYQKIADEIIEEYKNVIKIN